MLVTLLHTFCQRTRTPCRSAPTERKLRRRDIVVTTTNRGLSTLVSVRMTVSCKMTSTARKMKIIVCCAAFFMAAGCRVSQPGRVETALMYWTKHRLTVGDRWQQNPLGHGAAVARQGQAAFDSYCMACHGLDGQNTGVPFAGNVSPPIPSLASKQVQQYSDGQLKWIIENGISPSGMPASRGTLSEEEIWSIVEYLRHLPLAGSLGEPRFYTGACGSLPDQSSLPGKLHLRPARKRGLRLCARS